MCLIKTNKEKNEGINIKKKRAFTPSACLQQHCFVLCFTYLQFAGKIINHKCNSNINVKMEQQN